MKINNSKEEDFIEEIINQKIHLTTLPKEFGGKAYKPLELFNLINELTLEYPSKSLGISMHLYTVWGLSYLMNEKQKMRYFTEIIKENALFASLNEPSLYFVQPSEIVSDQFPIKAKKVAGGYIVNGQKRFVSFEPYVAYLPVYALVESEGKVGTNKIVVLIIEKNTKGTTVKNDWNSMSMSDTHSNSVFFEEVFVSDEAVICEDGIEKTEVLGYLFRLSVSSVYYSIGHKALNYITEYTKKSNVPHTRKLLAFFPGVQFSLSEMLVGLKTSYSQIEHFCSKLDIYLKDSELNKNQELNMTSLITKTFVIKQAQEIVEKSMKIQGIKSLSQDNLLANLYLDVKAGEFHPPQRDVTYELIAKQHLGIISIRNRWL
ncbi:MULTISPECIES: acyl-CoA dehydrogenase family protein [unclassified Planococcus (in: firmicutes)]|uniref:acyl-CoA dehydrogenase family protein n=1 Tax=unclassified Planococcus (in: firmicutes) TaxID=2662419 RepID=UPI000C7B6878|nr:MULTISPECIES: acyl-CoA dehydrogenase family protein [unclassified Planococcus (in: firmicutes)]PKG48899.1 hypothetical protein CXF66_00195 [Planococcus sp. Urea-trap-24]PKG89681.1 hypothetical protein CXF91_05720 [Planococcus sp. Urea-3u-39]PKH37049.1 hypothetical protein CXF77_12755 [Planococcus sp. MB-3u-09]